MKDRHGKHSKFAAPVTSVILAGILAAGLGLASGTDETKISMTGASAVASSAKEKSTTAKGAAQAATEATVKSAAKAPSDCDASQMRKAHDYPNGRIPSRYLCPLPRRGHELRADAALAFYKLNAAYKKRFGEDMCIRSSYRTFSKQAELFESMPGGMAARPGNSKHGLAIAADFCGGVEDDESPQFKWLRANSEKYDWVHPDWAYSSPYEPWHWEFDVGQND
ncbi:M15 family metallopeptidase [Spirillospora sp. CA-255316]